MNPRLRKEAKFALEEIEPRVLFSGDLPQIDLAGEAVPAPALEALAQARIGDAVPGAEIYRSSSSSRIGIVHEIAFVDTSLPDVQTLLRDLKAMETAQRRIDVVLLRSDEDGISQITTELAQRQGIDAVHLLTHGSGGHVQVGATVLDFDTLLGNAGQVRQWGAALSEGADFFVYGCEVAGSAGGRALIDALARLTGADVAASADLTGQAAAGGDWVLEYVHGEAALANGVGAFGPMAWQGVLSDEFLVNSTTASDQTTESAHRGSAQTVAMDAAGNYVVVWTSQNQDGQQAGVYARRFAANGAALTGELLVNETTSKDQKWAAVASDSAGNFVVTWTNRDDAGDQGDVYIRRFDGSGAALTSETKVNTTVSTTTQQGSALAMDSATGDFVVVWEGVGAGDSDGIFFRRYNADGTAKDAGERAANTSDDGDEKNAAVAMSSSGSFVVVWQRDNHVYFQRFNAAGTAQGSTTQVDSIASTSSVPDVAMNSAGDFTVLFRESITLSGVWGRGFNADGTQKYTFFQAASGDATDASIAMASDGSFILTYEATGDGGGKGVYARKYLSSGSADGSAFVVNQVTAGQQQDASVALLTTDNSVMVWSGNGTGDNNGVYARQFGAANTAPVNSVPAGQSVREDEVLIFSAGNGNLLSITDADAGTGSMQVTLTATHGVMTLGTTASLSFTVGDGTADATMTFRGTRAQINTALDGLQFTPTANFSGAAGLQIDTDDLGNTGFGGALTDSDTVSITVTAVNDAPAGVGDTYVVLEGQTLTQSAGGGVLVNDTDPEGDALGVLDVSQPGHGTLSVSSNGAFSYTPTALYTGPDSFSYLVRDTTDGRTHYWGLAGTANDGLGGSNGTVFGASTVSGQFGSALGFDGVSDYVSIPDFTYSNSFTVSLWFKMPTNAGTGFNYLYSHGAPADQGSLNVYTVEDGVGVSEGPGMLRTVLRDANDTLDYAALDVDIAALGLADNGWHLYTLTAQAGSGARVYIDGTLQASSAHGGDAMDPSASLLLGARHDLNSQRFLAGSLDGVQVHGRALQAGEITDLVNAVPASVSFTVTTNSAPAINSDGGGATAAITVAENSTAVTTVTAVDGEVPPQTLTYSLSGADAARFTIGASSGVLTFASGPDWEAAMDADGDNVYEVTVTVSDGITSDAQVLSVSVTDVAEPVSPAVSVTLLPPSLETSDDDAPAASDPGARVEAGATHRATDETLTGAVSAGPMQGASGAQGNQSEDSDVLDQGFLPPQDRASLTRRAFAIVAGSGTDGSFARQKIMLAAQGEGLILFPGMSAAPAAALSTEALRSSLGSAQWLGHLQFLRDQMEADLRLEGMLVGTTTFVSGGLSVGYVIWLLRGGLLMSTLLSALPAWHSIDPLPVLGQRGGTDDKVDRGDAIESLFERARKAWRGEGPVPSRMPSTRPAAALVRGTGGAP